MPKVYTLGYAQPGSQQRLEELMQLPSMKLIDTRIKPTTKYKYWHGDSLKATWGDRYHQAGDYLGNPNAFNDGPLAMNDPVRGINGLLYHLSRNFSVVLLCGCKHYEGCHRSHIIEYLKIGIQKASLDVEIMPEVTVEVMKCLSIKPPYGEWIVMQKRFRKHGVAPKTIENRDWTTKYRTTSPATRVLIHSSHSSNTFIKDALHTWSERISGLTGIVPVDPKGYQTSGSIIGVADLVEIRANSDDPWYVAGQYAWHFENARPLTINIPYRGDTGLFDVPLSVVADALPERHGATLKQWEADAASGILTPNRQRYLDTQMFTWHVGCGRRRNKLGDMRQHARQSVERDAFDEDEEDI